MTIPSSQTYPWKSFLVALPTGLGIPLLFLKLWATAIAANPNWRGGMFYFPTTFLELICLLVLLISASPFLVAMLIGIGVILPLFQSAGLAHQQPSIPISTAPIPIRSDLDFTFVLCFACIVQVIAWTILIEHFRSKRKRSKEAFSDNVSGRGVDLVAA